MEKKVENLTKQLNELNGKIKTLTASNESKKNAGRKESNKTAKEKVPVLRDLQDFPDFVYYLRRYFSLVPDIGKFIRSIKLPDTKDVVSAEQLYRLNKDALTLASAINEDDLNDFNIWITSKIHKDIERVHKRVDPEESAAKQLLEIWYNILNEFNRNSDASREAHQNKWERMKQPESGSWDKFRDEVVEEAKLINKLWIGADFGYSHKVPKIHDSDIWSKIKWGLNEKYTKILDRTIEKMDDEKSTTLAEKFAKIEAKLLDKGVFKKTESNTNHEQKTESNTNYEQELDALMARTNVPTKTVSKTDYSRVLMHKNDLKHLVCRHFNGVPDSCRYGRECRFDHINNPEERKRALRRQTAWFSQRKSSQSSRSSSQRSQSSRSNSSSDNQEDEAIAQYAELVQSKPKQAKKVAAMIASIMVSDDDSNSENETSSNGDYDDYLREHGVFYTEGTDQDEHTQQDCVVSSLAVAPSDSEEDLHSDDISDTDEIDIFDQNILKKQKKLMAMYHARDQDKESRTKVNKKEEKEIKRLNILLDKARRKNEKHKRDYAKYKELAANVVKEEERAKKSKEIKDRKEKEQKLRLLEEQERKRNELKRIIEETNKYKQFMEEDLLGKSDQSESDFDEPIKTKKPRAPGLSIKSVGQSVAWAVKWLFLIFSGLAVLTAITKLPELLSAVTTPIVTPSTSFDVAFSFVKSDHRRMIHSKYRHVGLTILDSGTTYHLTGDEGKFIGKLTKLDRPKRIQGFNSESSEDAVARYKGTIEIQATIGGKSKKLLLKDTLYVPCMKKLTLVSQGQLDDEGHKFITANGRGRCFHPDGSRYFDVKKQRGLYHVEKPTVSFLAMNKNLAHRKFGHLNEKDLDALGDWSGKLSP